ncbi:hypothetical protein AVEN_153725-1 [Araneus ventricosus]|uniref:Uncharacterized protein n=1 Tax=Araneus ventricosus TaxID=182803 RepID=A0A4Y2PJW1_ARAVE|nr:hypothetical protein AVEN_153725-1 [Araneus ventricosus]
MNLIYPICCDEDNAVRISVVADDLEKVKGILAMHANHYVDGEMSASVQLQQEKRTPGAVQGGQLLTYNQGRLNNSQHRGIEAPHQNRN